MQNRIIMIAFIILITDWPRVMGGTGEEKGIFLVRALSSDFFSLP